MGEILDTSRLPHPEHDLGKDQAKFREEFDKCAKKYRLPIALSFDDHSSLSNVSNDNENVHLL